MGKGGDIEVGQDMVEREPERSLELQVEEERKKRRCEFLGGRNK